MKWAATFLAAIVLAMPLGFAETQTSANTSAVSAANLHFKQIGQAFGDFAFGIKSFLTFDEKAKLELLKERNAEMQARQQEWISAKAHTQASENINADEKQDIESMIQTEHEAIIKEHLRLTEEIRDIQLKAKADGQTQLENEANEAADAEEHSGLSLGIRYNLKERLDTGVKVEVNSNVVLNDETKSALDSLVASINQTNVKIELHVQKNVTGGAEVKDEVKGELTAGQQSLLTDLETKAKALVEASANANARTEIEIKSRTVVDSTIDNAAEAQALVENRFHLQTSNVTTETRNGETVYVVTGSSIKTAGNFKLTKSFEIVIEADTGLILSADMNAHFETISSTNSAASAAVIYTSNSASVSASSNTNTNNNEDTDGTAGGSVAGSASVNEGNHAGVGASGSVVTFGGIRIG